MLSYRGGVELSFDQNYANVMGVRPLLLDTLFAFVDSTLGRPAAK